MKESLAKIQQIQDKLNQAEVIVIGAGAGLSTAAGYTYSGTRFERYFSDMETKYGYQDMYSGGFYPYESLEEQWAFWSRYVFLNRYQNPPKPVYSDLFELVKDKDYFVLTTNVDHCFQKAGFAKQRLFYTQGDYGLFQCSTPCHKKTYDNESLITEMVRNQGFQIQDDDLVLPQGKKAKLRIDSYLIPKCPLCGKPMRMNLREDDSFVEDEGWESASQRYQEFIEKNKHKRILFLELGVGYNTPGIIKYPFWQYTYFFKDAFYICINKGEAEIPEEIQSKAIYVDEDIATFLLEIKG